MSLVLAFFLFPKNPILCGSENSKLQYWHLVAKEYILFLQFGHSILAFSLLFLYLWRRKIRIAIMIRYKIIIKIPATISKINPNTTKLSSIQLISFPILRLSSRSKFLSQSRVVFLIFARTYTAKAPIIPIIITGLKPDH